MKFLQSLANFLQQSLSTNTNTNTRMLRMNSSYDLILLLVCVWATYQNDDNIKNLFQFAITGAQNLITSAFGSTGTF